LKLDSFLPNDRLHKNSYTLSGKAAFADGTGVAASFAGPWGVATDNAGNVYVADTSNHRIRIITASGVVSTLAGNGTPGFADDASGVSATSTANFLNPRGVATDSAGNVYVADTDNNRIRFITPLGAVTTIAGSGAASNVNAVGTLASFNGPQGIAFDKVSGNAYVADTSNHIIRKIASAASGAASAVVTTYAGVANINGSADGSVSVRVSFTQGV
jgi:sugar lactone lactonase YvrE